MKINIKIKESILDIFIFKMRILKKEWIMSRRINLDMSNSIFACAASVTYICGLLNSARDLYSPLTPQFWYVAEVYKMTKVLEDE